VSDRKILDTKAHGNLIVNDPVRARGKNAEKNDLELFHRKRVSAPNENKMSDGGRERALLGVQA
jgi:hypothetical protein